jgi:predicted metal-dependent peptidase
MPVSSTTAIERIARVIAGQQLSANADGMEGSAADSVNMEWETHIDDAYAILRTLREPDEAMAAAGDPETWERMINAAIESEVTPG